MQQYYFAFEISQRHCLSRRALQSQICDFEWLGIHENISVRGEIRSKYGSVEEEKEKREQKDASELHGHMWVSYHLRSDLVNINIGIIIYITECQYFSCTTVAGLIIDGFGKAWYVTNQWIL